MILGAGFDSRAYRFRQQLKNVKLFEVDFGPTQEYKKRRAGCRVDRTTFFTWEGVSMYLTEQSVRDFLHDLATHATPGSEVVFDHFNPFFDPPTNDANAKLVAMLKSWGEPWI